MSCRHAPAGEENAVGVVDCSCGETHSSYERCASCGQWVLWHDFPGRELKLADGGQASESAIRLAVSWLRRDLRINTAVVS